VCVGVTLWVGWGGVVWYPDAVHQPASENHTTTM